MANLPALNFTAPPAPSAPPAAATAARPEAGGDLFAVLMPDTIPQRDDLQAEPGQEPRADREDEFDARALSGLEQMLLMAPPAPTNAADAELASCDAIGESSGATQAPQPEAAALAPAGAEAPAPAVPASAERLRTEAAAQPKPAEAGDAAPRPMNVPVPVEHPRWGAAVGEQLTLAIGEGTLHAELRLDPPELGPVTVQIELDGDQASLKFVAPANATCQSLERALPTLRAALAAQGLNLAQFDVLRQTGPADRSRIAAPAEAETRRMRVLRKGFVDEYA